MQDIGVPYNSELNSGYNVGAKREPLTSDGVRRVSAYDGYYVPIQNRSNLDVVTYGQVQSLILSQNGTKQAKGVVYSDQMTGMLVNVTATKEVIMAAGTIQTPQLLMLSVRDYDLCLPLLKPALV
jgi:choline dehydrogenase